MPTGPADSLTPVARFIEWLQPERVLDIGIGSGRMGFLAREYGNRPWLRGDPDDGIVVDGIEGYEPYLGNAQRAIYDELIVGEANEVLARIAESDKRYDLVIAAEILEHFRFEEGAEFLRRCRAVGDVVLVTTPSYYFDQEIPENPLEAHRSFWSPAELRRAGATAFIHRGITNVCIFETGDLAERLRQDGFVPRPRWFQWILPLAWEELLRRIKARWNERQ